MVASFRQLFASAKLCMSALALSLAGAVVLDPSSASAQYTPATRAFEAPGCSASDLSSFARDTDLARINPEWKAIRWRLARVRRRRRPVAVHEQYF